MMDRLFVILVLSFGLIFFVCVLAVLVGWCLWKDKWRDKNGKEV